METLLIMALGMLLDSDSYSTRKIGENALTAICWTGYREPIRHLRRLSPHHAEICRRVNSHLLLSQLCLPIPFLNDFCPPPGYEKLHRKWRDQCELREAGLWSETNDIGHGKSLLWMRQGMTLNFVEEAMEDGCPPWLLVLYLRSGKAPSVEEYREYDE